MSKISLLKLLILWIKEVYILFELIIKDDFVYYEISRNISSTFYTIANNIAFPNDLWFDLPISVLTMWNENIIKNNNKKKCKFELFFMDGPFFIECLKEDNNITMKFIHNKKSSLEKFTIQTTFYELKNSVYRGTTQLIKLS